MELAVGDSAAVQVSGFFSDPDGDALTYAVGTSNAGVVTAAITGSAVTVVGVSSGTATVTVTATDPGGLAAQHSFAVTVPNRPPLVTDTIPPQRLTTGETRTWAGPEYFADPDGDDLTYTAGTTDASIVLALVSGDEFGILAVTPGTAMVTVTATDGDGLSASQSFQVTSEAQLPVIITDVEPAVLLEGANATIRGSGFSSVPGSNAVLVDGLAATVTAASSTSLSVIVPYSDCLPPRQAELRVSVLSLSDARTVGVTPRTREDLELPQGSYRLTYAGNGCLYLPGDASGGEYIIGVVSTSEIPSSLTPVTMTSILGDATVLADAPRAAAFQPLPQAEATAGLSPAGHPSLPAGASSGTGVAIGANDVGPRRNWQLHNELVATSEQLIRRLGPVPPSMVRARQSRALPANDTLTLFADVERTCTARGQVRAVVRLDGENALWLEDIDNPSGTFTETELAELDAFYASHVKGVHDEYFGDLSDVDGNGKILILMTKEANRQDLGGWVWSGDLFPPDRCGTTNHAEIFFGQVPDPEGVFGTAVTKQETLEFYPSLLTHEVTHLVQRHYSVFQGADFARWETEGGATLAEQLVAYRLFGHGSGQDLGYAAYQRGRAWYIEWVAGLARFFGWDSDDSTNSSRVPYAPEQCSWIGRPAEGNDGPCRYPFRAVYDVPSMVLRYAMDRWGGEYPGGERALMRRLSQSPERGLASLAEVSGWLVEEILADFYVALWIDLNGWEAYGMTSWDLADIWSRFAESSQLRPYEWTVARFRGDWSIRAGSTSYLHWTPCGSRGPTSLKVTSPSGARVPGHVSVWALRVR
ncbi:IPT/TIG domain-containing protein [Candidatus Palauibacter sp.]|uniref:IPT/TIG domain-containing protein n=1 Tax=Candidatus Palauibacter sp. TaxID=3101350 RepID=UPI003B028C87